MWLGADRPIPKFSVSLAKTFCHLTVAYPGFDVGGDIHVRTHSVRVKTCVAMPTLINYAHQFYHAVPWCAILRNIILSTI